MHKPHLPGEVPCTDPPVAQRARMLHLCPSVRQSNDHTRESWSLGPRVLLDYLIVYIAQGTGTFSIGAQTWKVGPATLFWVPPNTVHAMRAHGHIHKIWFHCDLVYDPARSHWDACIPSGTLDLTPWGHLQHPDLSGIDTDVSSWCGVLPVRNPHEVHTCIKEICRLHRASPSNGAAELSARVLLLIETVRRGLAPLRPQDRVQARMEEAASYVRVHADQECSLDELAFRFGYSPSHFRRLFRQVHSLSPRAFVHNVKMRQAAEQLVYSDATVTAIARSLGYATVHSFSRAFYHYYACSPRHFRRIGEFPPHHSMRQR